MSEWTPKALPRGYGPAAEEPPLERPMRCGECGCKGDDHEKEPAPDAMKDALEQIYARLEETHGDATPGDLWFMVEQAEQGLNVCGCGKCRCYKPVEVDPNDDGDAACDEARGT